MSPKVGNQENILIMDKDNVAHDTVEDNTLKQTNAQPNQTSATNIACRAIKCVGKTLLCVFTIPIMATLGTLSGFVSGLASCYYIIAPVFKKNIIYALILSISMMPPLTITLIVLFTLTGFASGINKGVEIAQTFSPEPLKTTWTETKDALLGNM